MLACFLPVLEGVWVLLGKEKGKLSTLHPHTTGRAVELVATARCSCMGNHRVFFEP